MSKIPTLIEDDLFKLKKCNLKPDGLCNNNLSPSFNFKEGRMPYRVSFIPFPVCSCDDYLRSKRSKSSGKAVCAHILYVLIYYYKLGHISISMYHKLTDDHFQNLLSYVDSWLSKSNLNIAKSRQKSAYNFTKETTKLIIDDNNKQYLNPLSEYYETEECNMCLESLSHAPINICTNCNNYAHVKCSNRWANTGGGCPLCRAGSRKVTTNTDEEFPALS